MSRGVQKYRIANWSMSAVLVLFISVLIWLLVKDGASNQTAALQPPPGTNQMLRALANYGFARSGRAQNTFFIPPKPNLGSHYVIYWKEENLLFTFPEEQIAPEVLTAPSLVIKNTWTLDSQNFKLAGDRALATSTYLETWEWALQRMYDAVAKGKMHVLNHKP